MKKTLLLLASVALLLVGCQKEKFAEKQVGGLTEVTFTASLDSGVATKAVADGDGAAASVNRCIMEIYYGGELFARQYAPVNEQKKATFTAQVVSNRTYTVAFWADKVDATTEAGLQVDKYYTTNATGGLQAITINGSYLGNDDARDAFFYVGNDFTVAHTGTSWNDIKLKRPFAQMNVITTDWDKVTTVASLKPEKVNVTLKNALVNFNAVTGVASGSQTLTYEAAVYTAPDPVDPVSTTEKTLSMDYLFASTTKEVIDIDWKALHGTDANVEHAFAAVPYQRNYRTNIKGALLTTTGNWVAEINPIWTGNGTTVEDGEDPYLVNYFAAGSIAAANEALKTNNAVSIENPTDIGTPVVIPEEQDGKNVLIKVTGASSGDIVVNKATDNGPATLGIESDSKTLKIDLPNSHVDLNKGNFTGVTANTSATTLVVGKDVAIETLTINGGNAEIYGLVNDITRASGVKAKWYADNREKLIAGLDKSIAGESVVLTADIDLNKVEWAPVTIGKAITFDGGNHTISNLKIAENHSDLHYGFIGYLYSNGVIKNLTIDGAQILLPESKGVDSRGAALVGIARDGDVINCHVKNVTVKAYQKVGGLIGQYSLEASGTSIVKDCSAEHVTISENQTGEGVWGVGGLIGSLCFVNTGHSITVEGCSVEDISIANSTIAAAPKQTAHAFIGTIRDDAEGAVATLTGNTVEQTAGLYTDMYSSDYFGWATNPECESHQCKIIIDGEEWAPNYPAKIVGGKGYATLAEALAAAAEGQTVQILKAGKYATNNLSTKAAVVEATVDGVVFNHTTAATSWVASCQGTTVKNVTWNVGNAHHQYFSNTNLENCTVNGLLCTHTTEKFKDCTFINDEGYNFWVYGNEYTEFDNCTFTCPGKNDGAAGCGSAINCYNEGNQAHTSVLVIKNCTFTAKEASDKYSAIYVKPETAFDIRITNSTCNDKFCTGAISGSKLWNLKADREGTIVSIDGLMVYPFSMDADGNYIVKNANGLKMAIKHWNALKVSGEKSITLADGTYNASDMAIFQNYANKSLLIKAENEKQAVITPAAGSNQLIFVVAGMSKTYAGHITIDGIKFDFSNASDKNIESDVIRSSDANGTYLPSDEKALYTGTYHYCHDITVKNCEIIGLGLVTEEDGSTNANENCSVVRANGKNQNAYNVKVQNCVIDKVGYVLTSAITTYAEVSGCTVTDSKCVINNPKDQTEYKIINNTISTYHAYCIRVDYGPLTVSNNEFDYKYSGTDSKAGVVVLRVSTGNKATITGNTFTKASAAMNDVYCISSWEIDNGDVTKTIPANTGIKDISKLSELEL